MEAFGGGFLLLLFLRLRLAAVVAEEVDREGVSIRSHPVGWGVGNRDDWNRWFLRSVFGSENILIRWLAQGLCTSSSKGATE